MPFWEYNSNLIQTISAQPSGTYRLRFDWQVEYSAMLNGSVNCQINGTPIWSFDLNQDTGTYSDSVEYDYVHVGPNDIEIRFHWDFEADFQSDYINFYVDNVSLKKVG